MLIPILYETDFNKKSHWCNMTHTGINMYAIKKKYTTVVINGESFREYDYDTLFKNAPRLLLLVGSSLTWIQGALEFFEKNNIDVVLCDHFDTESKAIKARVHIDYESTFKLIFKHLKECGCRRVALYGNFVHSSSDAVKLKCFREELYCRGITDTSAYCFDNNCDLDACYDSFKQRRHEFDAVICVNDIVAVSLVERLKKDSVRIPEDIQIISFGNSKLCEMISPSITAIAGVDKVVGRQLVLAFKYCYSSSNVPFVLNLLVNGELIQRESTLPLQLREDNPNTPRDTSTYPQDLNFYNDTVVQSLSLLEKLLAECDATDLTILKMFINNTPYDTISDTLFISRSSIFYRLRRIEDLLSLHSHTELKHFLTKHKFKEIINQ